MLLLIALVVLVIIFISFTFISTFSYWKKRNVPHPPVSYLFGNFGKMLTLEKSAGQIYADIYKQYPNLPYVGYYKINQPGLIVRDPEIIKNILIKNFDHFHDNEYFFDVKVDRIGGRYIFALKGKDWKTTKHQITPLVTTKKLKEMYPLFEDAINKLMKYLENEPDTRGPDGIEVIELAAKYTTEVVAGCVFGLEGKSFDEPNPKFREMGQKIFGPSIFTIIKLVFMAIFPSFSQKLRCKFIPSDVAEYFRNITMTTIKFREENKIVRNDFLDTLKERFLEGVLTEDDMVAHALTFFMDGFATTSSVIAHVLYELAANPDVQEKFLEEIHKILRENDGKLSYDILKETKYLDMIINESLRLHLPGQALVRVVTKPTHFPNINGEGPDLALEKGTLIIIPILGLHYDAKYFSNPHQFNPERFDEHSKEQQTKFVFMPFGEGPRNCHGQRFGLILTKLAVINIIANFEIKVNKKTKVPLEIDPKELITLAKDGLWLNFEKRRQENEHSNL